MNRLRHWGILRYSCWLRIRVQDLDFYLLTGYFLAPYVNRLDNLGYDGVQIAKDIHTMIKIHGYDTEVLGFESCCGEGKNHAGFLKWLCDTIDIMRMTFIVSLFPSS